MNFLLSGYVDMRFDHWPSPPSTTSSEEARAASTATPRVLLDTLAPRRIVYRSRIGPFDGIRLEFIRPSKPVENAFIESFNGRLRDECLNAHVFASPVEAQRVLDAWLPRLQSRPPAQRLAGSDARGDGQPCGSTHVKHVSRLSFGKIGSKPRSQVAS